MAINQYVSPTGAAIEGTIELIRVRADIIGIDSNTDEPEYTEHIEPLHDNETLTEGNKPWPHNIVYLDENGAEWLFHELKLKEESSP